MTIIAKKNCINVFLSLLCVEFFIGCNTKSYQQEIVECKEYTWLLAADTKKDSIKIWQKSNELITKIPNSVHAKIIANIGFSTVHEFRREKTLAAKHAEEAISLAQSHAYSIDLAYAYLQMIDVAFLENDTDKIIVYIEKLDDLIKNEHIQEPKIQTGYFLVSAIFSRKIQEHLKAIKYFRKSFEIAHANDFYYEEILSLNGLCWIASDRGEYDKALLFLNKSIAVTTKHLPSELGELYYEQSLIYIYQHQFEKAKAAASKAAEYYHKYNDFVNDGALYNILGDAHLGLGNLVEAKKNYDIALKKVSDPIQRNWLLSSLAKYYSAKNDYKLSIDYWKRYYDFRDSLISIQRILRAKNLEGQFKTEKKQREVVEQRLYFIAVVFILFIILIGVLFYLLIIRNNSRLKIGLAESESLRKQLEIEAKQRELIANTLWKSQYIEQNKEISNQIEKIAEHADSEEFKKSLVKIAKQMNHNEQDGQEWNKFKLHFEAVSPHFFDKLTERVPSLTNLDLKHCAYIKINLSPKQVAQILGISPKSVTLFRVRLKKKLNLEETQSLNDYLRDL